MLPAVSVDFPATTTSNGETSLVFSPTISKWSPFWAIFGGAFSRQKEGAIFFF